MAMEIGRVLKLLNNKASRELRNGLLEEARETANEAVNYVVSTLYARTERHHALCRVGCNEPHTVTVHCHTQQSILLFRKIGVRYQTLGRQRDDAGLTTTGDHMIVRSTQLLRITRLTSRVVQVSTEPSARRVSAVAPTSRSSRTTVAANNRPVHGNVDCATSQSCSNE